MPPVPTDGDDAVITVTGQLDEPAAAAVLRLVGAAADEDAVSPLSEHVLLHLRYGGDQQARNLLLASHGELAGYAHLDPGDPAEGPSGELVIDPGHRHQGLGLRLAQALLAEAGPRPLRLWAHGDLPGAAALAARAGFERVRALWTMRRSLQAPLDVPRYPPGITVRTFRVGSDEDAWLALNRKAFASHPEQGAWTMEDLTLREREPWFDPGGFFLAERSGATGRLPLDQDPRGPARRPGARPGGDRRGVRGGRGPRRARHRAGPRAHPGRAPPPGGPGGCPRSCCTWTRTTRRPSGSMSPSASGTGTPM